MKLLLDTHALLWAVQGDDRLSARARRAIEDGRNELRFSAVSIWEIATKISIGTLRVAWSTRELLAVLRDRGLRPLEVRVEHAAYAAELPRIHADAFDRLLVGQAIVERCRLVTGDAQLAEYPVTRYW